MDRSKALDFLLRQPYKLGHLIGFNDLSELHNQWIRQMLMCKNDKTLQAHRNSYKTTCVSIALAETIILKPQKTILFMRKTDNDIKEVVEQVHKILEKPQVQYLCSCIYGVDLEIVKGNSTEISTNLKRSVKGTAQLTGLGIGSSITGKHYDYIYTDDIVNISDRVSRAERMHTKAIYQELQNIKTKGGRIFNTGTPWHKDDCFSIMPPAEKYSVYDTGIIAEAKIAELKDNMTRSLFRANYELRHIAEDDVIFSTPNINADPALAEQGECHIDASYGGSDYTAFTICRKKDGKYYVYGKLWQKHIDDCQPDIIRAKRHFNAGRIYLETNGDKGYLARNLKALGERVSAYHEDMNKYLKITSYLKGRWKDVYFVAGTDTEYINQICDYNENAEHDDAPDSLASIIRIKWARKDDGVKQEPYPIWLG